MTMSVPGRVAAYASAAGKMSGTGGMVKGLKGPKSRKTTKKKKK